MVIVGLIGKCKGWKIAYFQRNMKPVPYLNFFCTFLWLMLCAFPYVEGSKTIRETPWLSFHERKRDSRKMPSEMRNLFGNLWMLNESLAAVVYSHEQTEFKDYSCNICCWCLCCITSTHYLFAHSHHHAEWFFTFNVLMMSLKCTQVLTNVGHAVRVFQVHCEYNMPIIIPSSLHWYDVTSFPAINTSTR